MKRSRPWVCNLSGLNQGAVPKGTALICVRAALNSAIAAGAEELVTACPLCMYNLVENATGNKLPVKYFTELLAEALGVKEG